MNRDDAAALKKILVGRRVRCVVSRDPWSPTPPGTLGTVTFVDETGTVFVKWDDGSSLGMIEEAGDRFEVLSTATA